MVELRAVLTEEWEVIPQGNLIKFIRSMRICLESVIRNRGGTLRIYFCLVS